MSNRLTLTLAALLTMLPAASLAQTAGAASASDTTTAVITGQGTVSRPPDSATVTTAIQTNDDVAATATTKNNAAFAALTAALSALHVDPADVKTTYYNVQFVPRPVPPPATASAIVQPAYPYQNTRFGYVVNRQLSITVSRIGDIGAVIDAAVKAGVTSVNGVQYGLKDRASANEAALALALADAANQARVVASASRMRLAGIKQIQVGQSYSGGPMPAPMRVMSPGGVAMVPTEITPAAVDVRATVTVTYYLKP